jgi:AAA15 family ATPase/GTPase
MIIDFTVENFKSIKEEQTFSMLVSNPKDEHPDNLFQPGNEKNISLLKTAIIYGANASGKTNLIIALNALNFFVINSTDLKLGEEIPVYEPFKLDKSCQSMPTKFEMEFIGSDKIRYRYAVSFNKREILFEELIFYPKGQAARLFLREKGKKIKYGAHFKGMRRNIENELIPNNLFLSKAANSNHEQLKDIYLHFYENFEFHTGVHSFGGIPKMTTAMLRTEENDNFKKKLINFLIAADTGIQSVGFEKRKMNGEVEFPDDMPDDTKRKFLELFSQKPITSHKLFDGEKEAGEIWFDLDEESGGTTRMYELAGKIIPALEQGHTFFVDELDNSLHPHLSEYILKLFNNPDTNPNNAQLIAATHDATLLDLKIFRRDQVWFTRKNRFGATEIFSLDEFKKNEVRKNTPFGKWYLDGRFGAIPLINKEIFRIDE